MARRRRAGRGAGAGRARRGARAVAEVGRPGQPGRLADGDGEAPRDRPAAPAPDASSASSEELGRELESRQVSETADRRRRARRRHRRRPAAPVFTACHPVLSTEARVALTLRLLGGLTTTRSRAPSSSRRRPSRSASCARSGRSPRRACPSRCPAADELAERLASVLEVVYLIFNEGYAATAGDDWMRPELCDEALRLGRILAGLAPREPEVHGLVALMEIQASRSRARIGPTGEPILLLEQDRARWDQLLIRRGLAALDRAERTAEAPAGRTCCRPRSPPATRALARPRTPTGSAIAALYDALAQRRAVAGGRAEPRRRGRHGLRPARPASSSSTRSLDAPALGDYHLLPTVRGDLLVEARPRRRGAPRVRARRLDDRQRAREGGAAGAGG